MKKIDSKCVWTPSSQIRGKDCGEHVLASFLRILTLNKRRLVEIAGSRRHLGSMCRQKHKAFSVWRRAQWLTNHCVFTLENTWRPKKVILCREWGPKRAIPKAVTSPEDRLGEDSFSPAWDSMAIKT